MKTIGVVMLPFGCNTSKSIRNIFFFFKFWPDNENFGVVFQQSIISLLQLVVNRNEWCYSIDVYFCQNLSFSHFWVDQSNPVFGKQQFYRHFSKKNIQNQSKFLLRILSCYRTKNYHIFSSGLPDMDHLLRPDIF